MQRNVYIQIYVCVSSSFSFASIHEITLSYYLHNNILQRLQYLHFTFILVFRCLFTHSPIPLPSFVHQTSSFFFSLLVCVHSLFAKSLVDYSQSARNKWKIKSFILSTTAMCIYCCYMHLPDSLFTSIQMFVFFSSFVCY